MAQEIARGEMELLTPDEIMDETELFLKNIDSPGTVFRKALRLFGYMEI